MTVAHQTTNGRLLVTADAYALELVADGEALSRNPVARVTDDQGREWSLLSLLGAAHTTTSRDETLAVGAPTVRAVDDGLIVEVSARSTLWEERRVEVHCHPARMSVTMTVVGDGLLDEVMMLGGEGVMPNGACGTFRSSIGFRSVFVPVPTEPVAFVRPAESGAQLGIVGDASAGRLHGIFSPPPLVLGLGSEAAAGPTTPEGGDWWALSVREAIDKLTFTTMRYEPLDGGFLLRFAYEGHTAVVGEWTSPALVLEPVADAWASVDAHREDLARHGWTPQRPRHFPWWREPMFCGWGAQVARAAVEGTEPASSFATQAVYDELLATMESGGVRPRTIVIDDQWQATYGTGEVDSSRWPDLKGWIAGQHDRGRKVLLWWKAWDPQGLPASECITDPTGRPVAADPYAPAYQERLRSTIAFLLGSEGLNADGFKVDFTQRAPSGRHLQAAPGPWGIASLHQLLDHITRAAHAAKEDALVITHAVHPSFADVGDMVRINDLLERDVAGSPVAQSRQAWVRADIVRRSQPGVLIDTDQWPMPNRAAWLDYADAQTRLGVPALYYVERIDGSGEKIEITDLERIAAGWKEYREHHGIDLG